MELVRLKEFAVKSFVSVPKYSLMNYFDELRNIGRCPNQTEADIDVSGRRLSRVA